MFLCSAGFNFGQLGASAHQQARAFFGLDVTVDINLLP